MSPDFPRCSSFHDGRNREAICEGDNGPEAQLYGDKPDRFSKLVKRCEEFPKQERHQEDQEGKGKAAPHDSCRPCGTEPSVEVGVDNAEQDDPEYYRCRSADDQWERFNFRPDSDEFAALD